MTWSSRACGAAARGISIVTSQRYIQPHPVRFIPSEKEIGDYLEHLGFHYDESKCLWTRDDGVQLADTHNRNFIIAPDEKTYAIDVQPRLLAGHEWDEVRPADWNS